jgi:PAS domain S-box-containing protein
MVTHWRTPAKQTALRILLLAIAYVISGRLSLLLAIPPGFVSGLFLPMGIALAAVLIWGFPMAIGVFIGSTILNISINPAPEVSFSGVLIAAEIACGSALASVVGASLIRRYIGFPNDLTDERNIFLFFILGGPIATSLSASSGVLTLYLNGIIPIKNLFYSWWTWWIGDAIGVLIAAPLVCVFFAEPRHFWRGRRLTVGVPLVLSSLVVIVIFVLASNNEQKKLNAQFRQQADLVSGAIEDKLQSIEHTMATLRGLFVASTYVSPTEFSDYIDLVVVQKEQVSGFSWNQRVLNADRKQFEAKMQRDGFSNFSFKEKDEQGAIVPAQERDDYIVITYIEPLEKNASILGFDVASDSIRAITLNRARDSGEFAFTQPLQLLQDNLSTIGVLGYLPVYENFQRVKTEEQRQQWLKGYVTAVVRTSDIVNSARHPYPEDDYYLNIVDITEPNNPKVFFGIGHEVISEYAQPLISQQVFLIGGRSLQISVTPTEKFMAEHVSLQSWFVLAGGLLFCGLLGGFLLLISGRTQHVSNMVELRTLELAAILENAVEAILVVDEAGLIQKANPAAAKLFNYPLAQFPHLNVVELVPALQNKFNQGVDDVVASPIREASGRCSNGGKLEIELSVSPLAIHERKLFTFIIHDASAKRKVDRLKAEFISTVSHELRTPLTSIRGALSIVLSGGLGDVTDKIKDLLSIASSNVDRLTRLVNDILDIDKLEFGNASLNVKCHEIFPLLQQSIKQNQGYASRFGVELVLDMPAEAVVHCSANIDQDRFLQVMANLLSNAIKFSFLDGVVRVQLTLEDHQLKIAVIDNGQGIAENFRQFIFQKFAQADSSDTRHHNGTGLGLSITKVIVERMGGNIHYSSIVGEGTTFYVLLPKVD